MCVSYCLLQALQARVPAVRMRQRVFSRTCQQNFHCKLQHTFFCFEALRGRHCATAYVCACAVCFLQQLWSGSHYSVRTSYQQLWIVDFAAGLWQQGLEVLWCLSLGWSCGLGLSLCCPAAANWASCDAFCPLVLLACRTEKGAVKRGEVVVCMAECSCMFLAWVGCLLSFPGGVSTHRVRAHWLFWVLFWHCVGRSGGFKAVRVVQQCRLALWHCCVLLVVHSCLESHK